MKWNKKGEEEAIQSSAMISVIIALLVLFIIGSLVFYLIKLFHKEGDVEACRLDVIKAWASKILGKGTPLTRLDNCPRGEIKVFKDETNDEINHYIAEVIDDCLYTFTYGSLDWTKSPWHPIGSNKLVCFICQNGQFRFEGNAKKDYQNSLSFFDYIKNYQLRNKQNLYDYTFQTNRKTIDFKGNFGILLNGDTLTSQNRRPFNTDYNYAILFTHVSLPMPTKFLNRIFDYSHVMALLNLEKSEDAFASCDILMN
jgi:hypothetical protein